jgi:hypothetical protein
MDLGLPSLVYIIYYMGLLTLRERLPRDVYCNHTRSLKAEIFFGCSESRKLNVLYIPIWELLYDKGSP